ncbi:NEDD8 ultimate buster 1-like [Dreissena polymorpha]|uniref:NEDD8 ultimate buster 1-like n=1 Tax=Dreissena polymorpha TaxID=45954 RepID=UPI00226491C4|nr:NEDD8 ultimate buster 1-like [Dreissena polymorpha]XP_052243563.1 NEDD8 ultimate buster 1-like [Dreissena polymorpha]
MATDEFLKKQLGHILNVDKVKLWELPYTETNGKAGTVPLEMIANYANQLNVPEEKVTILLEELRAHAVQKLAERVKFRQSGLATLKVKLSGQLAKRSPQTVHSMEIALSSKGSQLREMVAELVGHPGDQMKLISSGVVIKDQVPLHEHGVKNGSTILVLCLTVSQAEAQADEQLKHDLQDFRHAAELLSARAEKEYDEMDIQIADQTGKPIKLPAGEKKALTLAMALHEKGRQALKKKNITLALPLLLEADKEFRQCSSDIINSVDNYAILCLDIVWCYLCLKHMDDLPDAEERLRSSENFFNKSYGSSMERLMAVKGSTGEEQALFMKLHLLQGIVAFHQQRLEESARLLSRAEAELARLHIDEDKINTMMCLGYSEVESRLGLRSCDGNVANAVQHVMKRREEKAENARKRHKERKRNQIAKHLGKTANGQIVNVKTYETLIRMGYPKGAASEALRQANNDLNLALEVLQSHPEFLNLPDPEPRKKVNITDDMIAQVTCMGFEVEMARRALQKHDGDVSRAVEDLVNTGGVLPPPLPLEEQPGPSTESSPTTPEDEADADQSRKDKEAINRLVSDLPEDEEDYLDITLDEEREFLREYQGLVQSLRH